MAHKKRSGSDMFYVQLFHWSKPMADQKHWIELIIANIGQEMLTLFFGITDDTNSMELNTTREATRC
jgi:hypothetical protein